MLELSDHIAANVRAERARKRWRQVDLAEAMGISAATVSDLEAGKRKVSTNDLVPLCRALNVTMTSLVRGAEPQDLLTLGL
jgi:transcriptional regulator with XRE-family HTH domain